MQFEITKSEEGIILSVSGVLKKNDAIALADEISKQISGKPKKLALDFSDLAAISFDSIPFIVSAIERGRLGKQNIRVFGCNSVVERTLRGGGFERVGQLG